jgi:tRNA nucleotidyltransferase (CCA-adding enzyme)
MHEENELAEKLERKLPPQIMEFLKSAGRKAAERNEKAYIVGGVVRDLLLGIDNCDIDLTVEGDAVGLAREILGNTSGRITVHQQFNTAKIELDGWNVDFATARSETYARPGALPTITPASLQEDLKRRDFTINAMAIGLSGENYGKLYDPCNGKSDLGGKIIRILHDASFIDDSTRIWRGLRYEQRLGFLLEPHTLELLKRDIPMLDTVSGERIYYEIDCILQERYPERVFKRAYQLGVLCKLDSALKFEAGMEKRFALAREIDNPHSALLYWLLLTYDMDIESKEGLISRLRLPKRIAQALRDCSAVKDRLALLAVPQIKASEIYRLLNGNAPEAVTANIIASGMEESRTALNLYLGKLRGVKSIINGNDIMKMGVEQGPLLKKMLDAVLDARLNGEVVTREDELAIVRKMLPEGKT